MAHRKTNQDTAKIWKQKCGRTSSLINVQCDQDWHNYYRYIKHRKNYS